MQHARTSLDMTANEDAMTLTYCAPHDSIKEGYYRLAFPGGVTIYLSPKQVDALAFICRNPE